jgi:predicted transcriptional regulator
MGRKKETGYRNQMYILAVIRDFGPLYGQQIVDKTGLKREEVWRNLRVLVRKQILKKTKVGRVTYYEPIVNRETLEYLLSILSEGGLKNVYEKAKHELIRPTRKYYRKLRSIEKVTDAYENEIIEMGETPYVETLENAKKWRSTKKEETRANIQPSLALTSKQKRQNRELLTKPTKFQTKEVTTSTGFKAIIRKPTLFEISDIMKEIKRELKERHFRDPNLEEAIKRLLA